MVLKDLSALTQEQLKMLFVLKGIADQVKSGTLVVNWDGDPAYEPGYNPSQAVLAMRARNTPQSRRALRPKRRQCKRCWAVYDTQHQEAACPHSSKSLFA